MCKAMLELIEHRLRLASIPFQTIDSESRMIQIFLRPIVMHSIFVATN
jgi:hypothetical protein